MKHQVFDLLVPHKFDSEHTMKKELSEEQFIYATIVRELKDLPDIHLVLNEANTRDILMDILKIATN